MRSWSWAKAAGGRGAAANQRRPRSTRTTLLKPQMRKMSVALLDQGEIRPSRGVTVAARRPTRTGRPCCGP